MKQVILLIIAAVTFGAWSSAHAVGIGNDNPGGGLATVNVAPTISPSLTANVSANVTAAAVVAPTIDTSVSANIAPNISVNPVNVVAPNVSVNPDIRVNPSIANTVGQDQTQGQLQGQQQGQVQSTENSNNASQSTAITFAAPRTYRPPVNSAIAPTVFPTAPCMGSTSGGVTGTLISISGGSSWESKECMILETARNFEQAGAVVDAMHVRCQGKYAKIAPSCIALAEGKELPAVAGAAVGAGAMPAAYHPNPLTQQLDATQLY